MKKIICVPACLMATLFTFTACSDSTSLEPEASAEVNLPQSDIDLKKKLVLADKVFEDVVSNNNRLVFIDSIHFVRTLERLEIASREQDNALIAKGACRANQASDWYDRNYEGGAKKAEMKVLARNYFWGVRKLEAITKVFEWRSGKWRKTEDPIANAVWGHIYDSTTNECGIGATSVDRSNDVEDTHKLVCKLNWLPQFRIESGEVLSRHNLPGGISQELPLEW